MSDIVRLLKAEASVAVSGVAFRNLGQPGNNVSVKYQNNKDYCLPDSYSWLHREQRITEAEAGRLLASLPKDEVVKEVDLYLFEDGYTLKRENGHVYLPENNGFSIPARNQWVLRDVNGNPLDVQKQVADILSSWEPKIGKPLPEEERVKRQEISDRVKYMIAVGNEVWSKYSTKPVTSFEIRQDPDEIVVDGLTFSEAMERCAEEDGFDR